MTRTEQDSYRADVTDVQLREWCDTCNDNELPSEAADALRALFGDTEARLRCAVAINRAAAQVAVVTHANDHAPIVRHTAATLPPRRMVITLALGAMGEGATFADLHAWRAYVQAYWGKLADVCSSTVRRQNVISCAGSLDAMARALVVVGLLWTRYNDEMRSGA